MNFPATHINYSSHPFRRIKYNRTRKPEVALMPLIDLLEEVDKVKSSLLNGEFTMRNLTRLKTLLEKPLNLTGYHFEEDRLMLIQPAAIKKWLYYEAPEYHLDIRYKNQFPTYLLVKLFTDFNGHAYILKSLYASPDYPRVDDRMTAIRSWGREKQAIRLDGIGFPSLKKLDESTLISVGRVLDSAWEKEHFLVYYFFDQASPFRQIIELTSLVKNSRSARLRNVITPEILSFFNGNNRYYPQQFFYNWFEFLSGARGTDISSMEKLVRKIYYHSHGAWLSFLDTPVELSANHAPQPLWKWCYANYRRLHYVLPKELMTNIPMVKKRMENLDEFARKKLKLL